MVAFRAVLANPGNATPQRIRIGGASKAELLSRLTAAHVKLNPMAEQLFADARFTTTPQISFVEVVSVTIRSLGFDDGATFARIAAQASVDGLSVCPLELAPHLRLQFTDQPEGSIGQPPTQRRAPSGSLTVASTPPSEDQEAPWGFYLRRIEGVLWLRGYRSWPGHVWGPDNVLAFTRSHNAA